MGLRGTPARQARRLLGSTLLACALLGAQTAHAAAGAPPTTVLKVVAQEGTEPKFIPAGIGRVVGLCVDLFRAIERIEPGLIFVGDQQWLPLLRAHSELASHQHDALCAVQRTDQRARQYIFLDPPLFQLRYQLIARASDPAVITSWDDVRKLGAHGVVLTNRGYVTPEMLARIGGMQVDSSATSPVINLQKLVAGRGRFFLHRAPGMQGFIERAGVAGKVKILPTVMLTSDVYMAMGTHVDPAVRLRVQHAIELLEKNGEMARLLKKWD
ncbi:transporter substrate-binding domain-containing protein [Duganella sp. FT80W]|uniref:Transporter substrate-binding domain-containing protein n=1 Tax=Duganella guangzhouensis TaxID=2666084 RepID=A0A6I2L4U2_9BURK|nr:transporter substrate-binding domain-containing protein [Duganella guangzhouensis]MRW92207.1 transporter substrate-binding domain-containing protein [Duganella guangzhouensis]